MVVAEQFQLYEFLMGVLLVTGLVPLTVQFLRYRNTWFYSAYLLFTATAICTNLEAFVFPRVFNLAEHVTLMLASFMFWMTAWRSARDVVDADMEDVLREVTRLP